MRAIPRAFCIFLWVALSSGVIAQEADADRTPADTIAGPWSGLWVAERRFPAQLQGAVTLQAREGRWFAQVEGEQVDVKRVVADNGSLRWSFSVLDLGSFEGYQSNSLGPIVGHWTQPAGPVHYSPLATPLRLDRTGQGMFTGVLNTAQESYTLSMPLVAESAPGGGVRYRTFLRNPDRNSGIFFRIASAVSDGDTILFSDDGGEVIGTALVLDPGQRFVLEHRGEVFDFRRAARATAAGFYPRRTDAGMARVLQPADIDDGWQTAALGDTSMLVEPVLEMLNQQAVFEPTDLHAPYLHSLLVAHEGKLIVEEYFHGHHRDRPHDSRSAGKTITSVLLGMVIHQGKLKSVDEPVYPMFGGVDAFENPDPRKARITARHLVTMSSGLACDDYGEGSPGSEDRQWEQTEKADFYQFALDLPVVHSPGETAYYCSTGTNLLGGVISKATGEDLKWFFHQSFARPLQIDHYRLNLSPSGAPYMGGGLQLAPRDFLKVGQLFLDGGVWNGKRLVSGDWVTASFAGHASMEDPQNYGFAWWRYTYVYDGRQFETYAASGNGGQILMVVPDLELAIMMNAGNYSDNRPRNLLRYLTMWRAILPAAIDGADAAKKAADQAPAGSADS